MEFTQEQKEYILANCYELSSPKMAKHLGEGIAPFQINEWLNSQGIYRGRHIKHETFFSDEDVAFMKDHYTNLTYVKIGRVLGYTERQVRGKLNHLGLTKNRQFNKRYFQFIDTPLKAYFLGFIYADGWVCCNHESRNFEFGMELQYNDGYVLDKLNEELGGVHNVTYDPSEIHYIGAQAVHSNESKILRVYCKPLVLDLIQHNILPNKTLSEAFPCDFPQKYFFDFLRGYIDGDGCFYLSDKKYLNMHITCATKVPLEYIQECLLQRGINTSIYQETERKYRLCCFNQTDIKLLISRLYYEEGLFCLSRKLNIVNKFLGPAV